MSKSIDSRVVEMRFDNQNFENNVRNTILSLSNLDRAIGSLDPARSLSAFNAIPSHIDLSGFGRVSNTLQHTFSAVEVMTATALVNMTNASIRAGKKIGKAMIGPMLTGGKTRALNIEQAKFQFEGLGMDVEATMADASYAVDGTAYSLDAAAKVASQLGASGMRAGEDMRNALRGISGVAAMSGSSYEDIGNVFTKVAGQGRVMGDDLLRLSSRGINAAATIAKELGKTEAEVREMVTKGKISFKIFADAMDSAFGEHATAANKTFTGSMSNVRAALARIGEKFYTPFHKNLINPLNEFRLVINKVNEAVDPLFKKLAEFMEIFSDQVVDILKNITLEEITELIKKFTDQIKMEGSFLREFGDILKGVVAVFDIARIVIMKFAKAIFSSGGLLGPIIQEFFHFSASIGRSIMEVRDAIKESSVIEGFFGSILTLLKPVTDGISYIFKKLQTSVSNFKDIAKVDLEAIKIFYTNLKEELKPVETFMSKFAETMKKAGGYLKTAFGFIGEQLSNFITKFVTFVNDLDINLSTLMTIINGVLIGSLLVKLRSFVDQVKGFSSDAFSFVDSFKGIMSEVQSSLVSFQESLKAKALLNLAGAIGILAAALIALSMIDAKNLENALSAMTMLFTQMFIAVGIAGKAFVSIQKLAVFKIVNLMVGMSVALILLSIAMNKIAELSWDQIAKGGATLLGLMGIMVIFTKQLDSGHIKTIEVGALKMIGFAFAIKLLADVVISLSQVKFTSLVKGLGGLMTVLLSLGIFMNKVDFYNFASGQMLGLIVLGVALNLMASAIKKLGKIDLDDLLKGLLSISFILLMLHVYLDKIATPENIIKSSVGLLIVSIAINAVAQAIKTLGKMPIEQLAKGLGAFIIALYGMTAIMELMQSNSKDVILYSIGILILSVALNALAIAMKVIGGMSVEGIAKALSAIGISMGIFAVGLKHMTKSIPGAIALLIAAGALAVFVPALALLGSLSIQTIVKGLAALAGVFLVLGIGGMALSPLILPILGISAALLVLSSSVLIIGAGIALFGTGISLIATSLGAFVVALADAIDKAIKIIPNFKTLVVKFFKSVSQAVVDVIPDMIKATSAFLDAIIIVAEEYIPKILGLLSSTLISLADEIARTAPIVLETLLDLLISLIGVIKDRVPEITKAAEELVKAFIEGFLSLLGTVIQAGFDFIIGFLNGLADAIDDNADLVVEAARRVVTSVIDAVKRAFRSRKKDLEDVGENVGKGLGVGMNKSIPSLTKVAGSIANKVLGTFRSIFREASPSKEFESIGANAMIGLGNGLDGFGGKLGEKATGKLSKVMGNLADLVTSEMDLNPTIRPVLDMGGINSDLDSLFGRNYNMGVDQNLFGIGDRSKTGDGGTNIQNEIVVNITGNTISSEQDLDRIGNKLIQKITQQLDRDQRRSK